MKNNTLILKDSVAVKYVLGMHTVLSHYPTQNDFVFDCINYYTSARKKSSIDPDRIEISKQDLKAIFAEKLTDSVFVKRLKETIKAMIDLGKVTKQDEDVLIITRDALTDLYQIV